MSLRPPFVLELALGSASGEEEALVVSTLKPQQCPEMTKNKLLTEERFIPP